MIFMLKDMMILLGTARSSKGQQGHVCFWLDFHADWYDFVILRKYHPTTKMKSINWNYLGDIDMLVVREVEEACRRMDLSSTEIGMRRSWYNSMQLSMSTAQPRPFTGPYKASLFQLSMHSLQAFSDSPMLISRERK
jgi:hypothetical protein